MRVLFDQGTPLPLRKYLATHQVATAFELGWNNLKNGELLQRSEENGFSVLVTTDQNLQYQQNLTGRKIAIVCDDNQLAAHRTSGGARGKSR